MERKVEGMRKVQRRLQQNSQVNNLNDFKVTNLEAKF